MTPFAEAGACRQRGGGGIGGRSDRPKLGNPPDLPSKIPAQPGQKEEQVAASRLRAVVLGALALMLAGSLMASSAAAEAGPFWHHRPFNGKGVGEKIEHSAPENVRGTGGEQTIKGTSSGEPIEIVAKRVQVKGAIYNGANQGQIKMEVNYLQTTLAKPVREKCFVSIGKRQIKGHLMWKWDGTKEQLKELPQAHQTPDVVYTPIEPVQPVVNETVGLFQGGFNNVVWSGGGCAPFESVINFEGSQVLTPSLPNVEEWASKLTITSVAATSVKQHYWGGKAFVGVEKAGLLLAGNPATIAGQIPLEPDQQEIAIFEK